MFQIDFEIFPFPFLYSPAGSCVLLCPLSGRLDGHFISIVNHLIYEVPFFFLEVDTEQLLGVSNFNCHLSKGKERGESLRHIN